jgi:hypothetical protein
MVIRTTLGRLASFFSPGLEDRQRLQEMNPNVEQKIKRPQHEECGTGITELGDCDTSWLVGSTHVINTSWQTDSIACSISDKFSVTEP